MITVAGVTVPRAAIARLAQQMQTGEPIVANLLGRAIDANLPELQLHPRAADSVLAALDANPVEKLEPLRQQLHSRARDSEAHGALYVVASPTTTAGRATRHGIGKKGRRNR